MSNDFDPDQFDRDLDLSAIAAVDQLEASVRQFSDAASGLHRSILWFAGTVLLFAVVEIVALVR